MALRLRLLLALLLYVTFDLSLPAMPGAFVFDAGDSAPFVGYVKEAGSVADLKRRCSALMQGDAAG